MGIKSFIIKRHILAESKMFFTNFSAFVSVLGVSIAVASLIVVLSVTSGFQKAYKDKISAHTGEIFIRKYGVFDDYQEVIKKVLEVDGVKGATPINYYQVLISSEFGDKGAQIKAIDLKSANSVSNYLDVVKPKGAWKDFSSKEDKILLGSAMAESLNIRVGDRITITFPFDKSGNVSSHPKILSFEVSGFISTGMYDYDNHYTYVSLENKDIFYEDSQKVKGIEVKINNSLKSEEIAEKIRAALGYMDYPVTTFEKMHSNMLISFSYQKMFIGLVLVIIMILASFSIIGTLLIFVTEKEKDIALLKALGVSKKELWKLFVLEGSVIGFIGVVLGLILSFLLLLLVNNINLEIDPDVYNISYIPISVSIVEVVFVVVLSMLISILSTLYPSYRASRLNPAEGLSGRSLGEN